MKHVLHNKSAIFLPASHNLVSFQHHSSGDNCLTFLARHELKAKQNLYYLVCGKKAAEPISGGKQKGQGHRPQGSISPVPLAPVKYSTRRPSATTNSNMNMKNKKCQIAQHGSPCIPRGRSHGSHKAQGCNHRGVQVSAAGC